MKYVSRKEQVNYLAGLSGQNLVYSLIGGSFFTYFMTDIAMFPAAIVSVILILMKVWDGINDPIVGSFVDRHSFKNGEKLRPFLRYTPLPVGVFTVLIFLVFSTEESLLWLRVSYFIIMYIAWDIAYTLQDVSIWGITASVSPDSNERDNFIKWARTVGSLCYGVFNMLIHIDFLSAFWGCDIILQTFFLPSLLQCFLGLNSGEYKDCFLFQKLFFYPIYRLCKEHL